MVLGIIFCYRCEPCTNTEMKSYTKSIANLLVLKSLDQKITSFIMAVSKLSVNIAIN